MIQAPRSVPSTALAGGTEQHVQLILRIMAEVSSSFVNLNLVISKPDAFGVVNVIAIG